VCQSEQQEMLRERWSPGVQLAEACETMSCAGAQ
jgi:hypothetical protein